MVWYDWFAGVTTAKICATATQTARIANVVHPGVSASSLATNGIAVATAMATTSQKYPIAASESPDSRRALFTGSPRGASVGIALTRLLPLRPRLRGPCRDGHRQVRVAREDRREVVGAEG